MRFTCDDLRERWPEFVYRELSEPEQSLFVRHLEECSECRNEELEWRELLEQFDSIASLDGSMEAPPELVYRVRRQVRLDEDWSRQFTLRVKRWMMGTMAACLFVAIGLYCAVSRAYIHPIDPGCVSAPLQKTVLRSIYQSETLKLYREQGIFEEFQKPAATCLAAIRIHNENPGEKEKG